MLLKHALKDKSEIPKTKRCICPICGYENGFNKDRLLKLAVNKYYDKDGLPLWFIHVSFVCIQDGIMTDFWFTKSEDPTAWQASINLYGTIEANEGEL